MNPAPPLVAGVRLDPAAPVLWVESAVLELPPGCLCLLHTPEGRRSARLVVAPDQLLRAHPAVPGYTLLGELIPEEALEVEPASSLLATVEEALRGVESVSVSVAPDGSRISLLTGEPERLEGRIEELRSAVGVPVVVRDEAGRLRDPALPDLLQELTYGGETATVTGISVFRGTVTLQWPDGGTDEIPLAEIQGLL